MPPGTREHHEDTHILLANLHAVAESLAEVLRFFRSAAHLSQEALAERAGLSTRTVSDIETGSARTPRLVTIMLLAEAMGLSATDRSRLQEAARKPLQPSATLVASPATSLQRPSLVGRKSDLESLDALLARNDVRLITLVGPAGVGKTSLAIGAALGRNSAYERGVAIVELAVLDDPALVPAEVARSLGLRESNDTSATEAVTSYLRPSSTLLVLDNLEHLAPAAAWIGALLSACPRLTIVATSREPLHLKAEHVYTVRPLHDDAAIALFVQRAQMVKPEFEVTAANASAVATIVQHLEGLPLAIELAAPRLSLLTARAMASRLERRLPLLADGSVDRPQRQRTMHAAIAWSYDLLSDAEQRLFRRLAVLQNGGDLEAVAAIAGDEDARPILFQIAPLVEKSMLTLREDAEAEPRVSMLEMLREYAHERLAESGDLDDAQQRHASHVLGFAERSERELSGAAQGHWLARFETEHANIRAALQWASRSNDAEFAFRLVAAVWRFWWLHGHLTEGLDWVRRFLKSSFDSSTPVPDVLYAKALRAHVVLLSALGNFDEALASCENAVQLQRRIGDQAGLGASLTSLGIIFQYRGEYDRAGDAHAEGLAIRQRLNDEIGVATSLSNLSSIAFSKNDLAQAAALGNESVAIYRRFGHQSGLAHALLKIGLVAAAQQQYDRAEEIFNECLRMQRAVGNTGSIHYSLENLATVAHRRGDYELALVRYHEVLDLLEAMPNKAAVAKTLEDLAATIAALGDPSKGARMLGAADALRKSIGSPIFPAERADYDSVVATVRATLGDDAFDAQWDIGSSITLERALEEARSVALPHDGAR